MDIPYVPPKPMRPKLYQVELPSIIVRTWGVSRCEAKLESGDDLVAIPWSLTTSRGPIFSQKEKVGLNVDKRRAEGLAGFPAWRHKVPVERVLAEYLIWAWVVDSRRRR